MAKLLAAIFLFSICALVINAQCDVGWQRSMSVKNKCYKWVNEYVTYISAESACENMNPNSTLMTISSPLENSEVFQAVSTTGYEHWIGLNCIQSPWNWVWMGTERVRYTNWNIGNPSEVSNWECAYIDNFQGYWWNWDCTTNKGYICEYYLY